MLEHLTKKKIKQEMGAQDFIIGGACKIYQRSSQENKFLVYDKVRKQAEFQTSYRTRSTKTIVTPNAKLNFFHKNRISGNKIESLIEEQETYQFFNRKELKSENENRRKKSFISVTPLGREVNKQSQDSGLRRRVETNESNHYHRRSNKNVIVSQSHEQFSKQIDKRNKVLPVIRQRIKSNTTHHSENVSVLSNVKKRTATRPVEIKIMTQQSAPKVQPQQKKQKNFFVADDRARKCTAVHQQNAENFTQNQRLIVSTNHNEDTSKNNFSSDENMHRSVGKGAHNIIDGEVASDKKLKAFSHSSSHYKKLKSIKGTEPVVVQMSKQQKQKKLIQIREQFKQIINRTNSVSISNSDTYFKAYVQKGNNGVLVKELIKKRWWWHLVQGSSSSCSEKEAKSAKMISNGVIEKKKMNLLWTEWINSKFIERLDENPATSEKIKMSTIYDDFQAWEPEEQSKLNSVKLIMGEKSFREVRPEISLRSMNYFKNRQLAPLPTVNLQPNAEVSQGSSKMSPEKSGPTGDRQPDLSAVKIHNHVAGCLELHSKKLLFKNLTQFLKKKQLDPFQYIPLTFEIDQIDSPSYTEFLHRYDSISSSEENSSNVWILKPGENSNRGFGISVHKQKAQIIQELRNRLSVKNCETEQCMENQCEDLGESQSPVPIASPSTKKSAFTRKFKRSIIVQKYIENCYLINKRKFDFRCYILLTTVNGSLKGYWYNDGYIRTSSEEYSLEDVSNKMIHLTNEAVQEKNSTYGKFEDYNKMNYDSFKKCIQKNGFNDVDFERSLKAMKEIAYYLIASVSSKIKRKEYTFELFGLDFMLDSELKPFLIEANSNPCLETKGILLTNLIRNLIDNVLMTVVDPLFPPPMYDFDDSNRKFLEKYAKKEDLSKDYFKANKFELIFSDSESQSR